ncbi:TetR/AcrR family transcriptional regulator [Agrobacterium bohemicum]|uniref:TetR family transcriptional regulator n=1 Tax=Agrobacterium bohemicum TaxID=2052828 RepID=A0A135P6W8_9HYPH|nr:TetR/AcrR family transcriptional regulator [Agrobacterium bohemicum]KXG87172.1 TetR family transcriptional regulator [Agrobacterium bohemicum]
MARLTRAEQKALRPTQILEAAFEEFVLHGFTAARVEDIADRVGVTKGTVYVYFSTKEELFAAMIQHAASPLERFLKECKNIQGNCVERLRSLILLAYNEMSGDKRLRELLRFVVSEGTRFPDVVDKHYSDFIEPLIIHTQDILDEGIKAGEFATGPRASARVIIGPIVAMIVEMIIHGDRRDLNVDTYVAAHVDLVISSLVGRG